MTKKEFINTGQILTASDFIKSYESSLSLTNNQIVCVYRLKMDKEPDVLFFINTTPTGQWTTTVQGKRLRSKRIENIEDKIWDFIKQNLYN